MTLPSNYSEVKLERGKLIDQIKNHQQSHWIKACEKLKLHVSVENGKGSHCAVYKDNVCSPSESACLVLTIPNHLFPQVQRDLFKKLLLFGLSTNKYTEDDMWKSLGVKIK